VRGVPVINSGVDLGQALQAGRRWHVSACARDAWPWRWCLGERWKANSHGSLVE
jgi:hypothetical protein